MVFWLGWGGVGRFCSHAAAFEVASIRPNSVWKAVGEGNSRSKIEFTPVEDGNFVFHDTSMAEFAEKLSQLRDIDRPVVDRTGIKGIFDITLKGAATAMLQPDGPSLFTLVQEQLGLKLVTAKTPIAVLVVDHAENPSLN